MPRRRRGCGIVSGNRPISRHRVLGSAVVPPVFRGGTASFQALRNHFIPPIEKGVTSSSSSSKLCSLVIEQLRRPGISAMGWLWDSCSVDLASLGFAAGLCSREFLQSSQTLPSPRARVCKSFSGSMSVCSLFPFHFALVRGSFLRAANPLASRGNFSTDPPAKSVQAAPRGWQIILPAELRQRTTSFASSFYSPFF